MMTKLMTWFIELQNRFNESRLFKILIIYVSNQVDDLTSWQRFINESHVNDFNIYQNEKSEYLF